MSFVKRLVGSRPFQKTTGVLAAEYLRLVWKTTWLAIEPEGVYEKVDRVARVAGLGVVKLASASGRPIYPIAIATRRRVELNNWDRTAINLPFGRGGGVAGEPIRVAADADAAALETARCALETSLNAATARAYALADRPREQDARA